MATAKAVAPPRTDVQETGEHTAIEMEPQSGVGRKRRASRRGGFREQGVNAASPVPPTGPQAPVGGRRRTRKHKSRKRHTRRH
jgi:hypothetical protein